MGRISKLLAALSITGVTLFLPFAASSQAIDPEKNNTPETAALLSFFLGCLEPLNSSSSVTEYIAAANNVKEQARQSIGRWTVKYSVGVNTCKVEYTGPKSNQLLQSWVAFKIDKTDDCKTTPVTANGFSISCAPTEDLPGYNVELVRSGNGDQGRLAASLAFVANKLPSN